MTHEDPTKRLTKYLSDAIPLGEHPTPFNEWISVRLDIVQETIDHLDWLEKGNAARHRAQPKRIKCPHCNRHPLVNGLKNHLRDKHGIKEGS